MPFKTVPFDRVDTDAPFTHAGVQYVKVSARKAAFAEEFNHAFPHDRTVRFKPSETVTVFVPDPTEEEIAAEKAQHAEWMDRRAREWFDSAVERGRELIEDFKRKLDEDGIHAFEWGTSYLEAAATARVAAVLKTVYERPETGGLKAAVTFATAEALRGARYPQHSTSAMSNLSKEAITAAYAKFVDDFWSAS